MCAQGGTERSELFNVAGHGPDLKAKHSQTGLYKQAAPIFPLCVRKEEALSADTLQVHP